MGKLLAYFGRDWAEGFPGAKDGADQLVPVADFASWLRNLRVRKGLQVELARILGVSKAAVCRYERSCSRLKDVAIRKLKKAFKLNGEMARFL